MSNSNIGVGDVFDLNLIAIFEEGFHEDLKGTPDFGEMPLTYGKVVWSGDGDVPGTGEFDYYDWVSFEGGRVSSDTGWLELHIVSIDYLEESVASELVGYYGTPKVKLTFDEFDRYAQFP